jgi:carbon-monoxide dehydrogenase medium subunit
MMNFRLAAPAVLVDLNRIPELAYIKVQGDTISIGAMTRQRAIEFSALVAGKLPLLHQAIKLVGHLPTRSRGTIGGSIANADPAAEIPMVLQALEGSVVARGPKGERTIAAADLLRDAMTTSLAADEILVEVRLPAAAKDARCAIEEFARRHGDFAIASAAALVALAEDGSVARATLALGGVAAKPTRLSEASDLLAGHRPDAERIAAAVAPVAAIEPLEDPQIPGWYRRRIGQVMARRALERAASRAAATGGSHA